MNCRRSTWPSIVLVLAAGLLGVTATSRADESPAQTLTLADGHLQLAVPTTWQNKPPAINMIEREFVIPGVDGAAPGRLTMMQAGGSVNANIDRWKGQFKLVGDDAAATKVLDVAGQKVHRVDLRGTYQDRAGPAAPPVARENYRMLAAVVELKSGGLYFVKLYGPAVTMAAQEAAFDHMLQSITAK